jgi:hypothetical protein
MVGFDKELAEAAGAGVDFTVPTSTPEPAGAQALRFGYNPGSPEERCNPHHVV